jgi:plasmid stabilization system protein ParE
MDRQVGFGPRTAPRLPRSRKFASADRAVRALAAAPSRLVDHARIGQRLDDFNPREGRRIFVGVYEIRYELENSEIVILRL